MLPNTQKTGALWYRGTQLQVYEIIKSSEMRGRKKEREEEIREARDVFKKKNTNPNEKIEVWRFY